MKKKHLKKKCSELEAEIEYWHHLYYNKVKELRAHFDARIKALNDTNELRCEQCKLNSLRLAVKAEMEEEDNAI